MGTRREWAALLGLAVGAAIGGCAVEASVDAKVDTFGELKREQASLLCECTAEDDHADVEACVADTYELSLGFVPAAYTQAQQACIDGALRQDVAGLHPYLDCLIEGMRDLNGCLRRQREQQCAFSEEAVRECEETATTSSVCSESPGIPDAVSQAVLGCVGEAGD